MFSIIIRIIHHYLLLNKIILSSCIYSRENKLNRIYKKGLTLKDEADRVVQVVRKRDDRQVQETTRKKK